MAEQSDRRAAFLGIIKGMFVQFVTAQIKMGRELRSAIAARVEIKSSVMTAAHDHLVSLSLRKSTVITAVNSLVASNR